MNSLETFEVFEAKHLFDESTSTFPVRDGDNFEQVSEFVIIFYRQ